VNNTVALQPNNNLSSTLFYVTGCDVSQTVENAVSAVRNVYYQRGGVVLARIFSVRAERRNVFNTFEHLDVF
jgi:hypothetical protein